MLVIRYLQGAKKKKKKNKVKEKVILQALKSHH